MCNSNLRTEVPIFHTTMRLYTSGDGRAATSFSEARPRRGDTQCLATRSSPHTTLPTVYQTYFFRLMSLWIGCFLRLMGMGVEGRVVIILPTQAT